MRAAPRVAAFLLLFAAASACGGREQSPAPGSEAAAAPAAAGARTPRAAATSATARTPAGEVRESGAPRRIVSLAPSATEILFALGLGERVVGVDAFSDFPPEARSLPQLGGLLDPDLEATLRLAPDLVVLVPSEGDVARALGSAGIRTLMVPHEDLADVEEAILAVGRATGVERRAARLARGLREDLARASVERPGAVRPRVLFVVARDAGQVASLTAAGDRTYLDELLRLAGGRNVLADSPVRYPQLSAEGVIRLQPDVILEWAPGVPGAGDGPAPEDPARLAEWERLPGIPAVERRRLHVLHDALWLRPGPRVPEALRRLAPLLDGSR